MCQSTRQRVRDQIHLFREAPEKIPFADLLDPAWVQQAVTEEGLRFRERIFTPLVVLWTFLSQVLSTDHSCRKAVSRLVAYLAARGRRICDPDIGGYCKARGAAAAGGDPAVGVQGRRGDQRPRPGLVALEGPRGRHRRRHDRVDARHRGEPAGLPPAGRPGAGAGFPHRPRGGADLLDDRRAAGPGDRPLPGETDRRDGAVPRAAGSPEGRPDRAGGPCLRLVLRDLAIGGAVGRRAVPAASVAAVRLPPRPLPCDRGPRGAAGPSRRRRDGWTRGRTSAIPEEMGSARSGCGWTGRASAWRSWCW